MKKLPRHRQKCCVSERASMIGAGEWEAGCAGGRLWVPASGVRRRLSWASSARTSSRKTSARRPVRPERASTQRDARRRSPADRGGAASRQRCSANGRGKRSGSRAASTQGDATEPRIVAQRALPACRPKESRPSGRSYTDAGGSSKQIGDGAGFDDASRVHHRNVGSGNFRDECRGRGDHQHFIACAGLGL